MGGGWTWTPWIWSLYILEFPVIILVLGCTLSFHQINEMDKTFYSVIKKFNLILKI